LLFIAYGECRLADIGSGAGFPGLAVKIACPEIHLTLIESNKKKCAFLIGGRTSARFGKCGSDADTVRRRSGCPPTWLKSLQSARSADSQTSFVGRNSSCASRARNNYGLEERTSTRVSSMPGWIWKPQLNIQESQRRFILIGRPGRREIYSTGRSRVFLFHVEHNTSSGLAGPLPTRRARA